MSGGRAQRSNLTSGNSRAAEVRLERLKGEQVRLGAVTEVGQLGRHGGDEGEGNGGLHLEGSG